MKKRSLLIAMPVLLIGLSALAPASAEEYPVTVCSLTQEKKPDSQHKPLPQEKVYRFGRLDVAVKDFPAEGLILDIGGGGEGVIGQLKGRQVVAIDLLKRELEDAPGKPLLKIVMDARDLKFLDRSFSTATVFFTFMYIASADHPKVFQELHRVLTAGGRLLIWDVIFPKRPDETMEAAVFPLKIKLPAQEITTGYGVRWPEDEQGPPHYIGLAREAGFEVISQRAQERWFFLELRKPGQ